MNHASSAGIPQQAERRGTDIGVRHDLNYRLQATSIDVDDPRLMCRRSLVSAADGAWPDPTDPRCSRKHRMAGMRMAFAASGGLRSVGELARHNGLRSRARFARIARWIATREIIGFMWESEPWVPMFQLDTGPTLQPRQDLQPLFKLLIPFYDAWAMANWFARPNQFLSGHRPVDDCAGHLDAVLDVAHSEHFIATVQAQRQIATATGAACNWHG